MFLKRSHYQILTLFLYFVVALAFLSSADAHIHHRDHVSFKRFLRKRSPQKLPPILGDIDKQTSSSPTPTPTSSSSSKASSTSSTSTSPTSTSQNTGTTPQTPTATPSNSPSSSASGSLRRTESDSASQETASPSANSQAAASFSSAPSQSSNKAKQPSSTASSDPFATPTNESSTQSSSTKKGATIAVLVIIASSVGAVAVLWTVFRKWKLARSSRFDQRLNPIDWQPTNGDDGALPGSHRRLSGTSFHSNPSHGSPVYGADNTALSEHDFTAGPAAFAPVGGYADLARAPGPQPLMHQAGYRTVTATNSYDVGVPLHHQGAYVTQEPYDPSGRY